MEVLYVSKKPTMAKQSVTDAKRPPLVPSEKNNAVAVTRRTRSMDVSSRYRSPTPTKDRRCPSPTVTRIVPISSQLLSRRAVSVERQRSLIPSYPSTPVSDISIELPVTSRRLSTENLWPSTMRSLSVSFQSDAISVPVVKKEKPFVTSPNDRTLRPPSNIAYKQQGETTSVSRKHTPERKRSPLKGKNVSGQSENSKPVDGSHSRIIEQHRWPSRKITLNSMNRSLDLGDRVVRRISVPLSPNSKPLQKSSSRSLDLGDTAVRRRVSLPLSPSSKTLQESSSRSLDLGDKAVRRRMSLPLSPSSKTLQKSSSDAVRLLSSYENGGLVSPTNSEDGNSLTWTSSESPNTLNRTALPRFQPSSAPGSRAASPSRSSLSSSSSSSSNSRGKSPSRRVSPLRGLSPSRGANISCLKSPTTPSPRGLSPSRGANISCLRSPTTPSPRVVSPSRGANNISCLRSPTSPLNSPSRIRQTNTSAQSRSNITSVLSFFADVKKGKKATYIEDVHQLRMLYNRYSQWRFANARSDGVRYIQSLIAEETLYNVWHATSDLRDLVTAQRICLQQQKLEIKLESILNDQIGCLEDWSILEREHISSLAGAIADLEANTTRLPLTGGTKADLRSLKLAMSSAVDVMQAMESSIRSLHSQMEEMNKLASGLAVIATKEKFLFDKCEDLLASTTVMEIEERSIMAHLIQKKK